MPPKTTPQRNPRSPKHRRTVPQSAQTKQSRERAQNTDLTRFGLVAYVLGARKGEGFYWFLQINTLTEMGIGKVLPLLYSPPWLHTKTLLSDLSQDTSQDTSDDTNPRNSTQPFYRVQNNPFRKQQTRLSVDRAGWSFPTESWVTSVGRPDSRPSSSCGRSDRLGNHWWSRSSQKLNLGFREEGKNLIFIEVVI